MIEALRLLGFTSRGRNGVGAECVSSGAYYDEYVGSLPVISSFCPAANALIIDIIRRMSDNLAA